jgi:hypothetical protein
LVGGEWVYQKGLKTTFQNYRIPINENRDGQDYSGLDDGQFGYPGTIYFWTGWYPTTTDRYITFDLAIQGSTIHLEEGEKIRLMLYFLDLSNFFLGGHYIDLLMNPGAYFEVVDKNNSATTQILTQSFSDSTMFTLTSSLTPGYNDTLMFDVTSSLLYGNSIYSPSSSIAELYSPVTDIFTVKTNDMVRLTSIEQVDAQLYQVSNVIEPIASGSSVSRPLQLVLNQAPPSSSINPSTFAILRPVPDETSVIMNRMKQQGIGSSGVLIPEYLDPNVESNISNIIAPLTGTLLPQ